MKITTKKDAKEKLLTIALFTGIFLPVRLVFYNYVSEYWIGSFGLITGIMLALIYFSNKGKLGKIGYIVNKQVMSFSRGRYGKIAMIQTVFFIYFFSLAIYGIEMAPQESKDIVIGILAAEGVEDLESLANADNLGFKGGLEAWGIIGGLAIIIIPNELGFTLFSVINDFTNNWLIHFTTVFLVEHLEVFGLVVYFRYFYRGKLEQ